MRKKRDNSPISLGGKCSDGLGVMEGGESSRSPGPEAFPERTPAGFQGIILVQWVHWRGGARLLLSFGSPCEENRSAYRY